MGWAAKRTDTRARMLTATAAALGLAVSLAGGSVATAASPSAAPAVDDARPALALTSVADRVTAYKYGRWVYVDLGAYLVAGDDPFKAITTRAPSYRTEPLTRVNGTEVPAGLGGFGGLTDFLRLRVTDRDGAEVFDATSRMCLNRGSVRTRPDAPDTSNFPPGCRANPFILGEVQGVEAGWGVSVPPGRSLRGVPLGRYDVTVAVTRQWRDIGGIDDADALRTIRVRVVDGRDNCGAWCRSESRHGDRTQDRELTPRAQEPSGPGAVPAGEHLPDLRSLPAYGIGLSRNGEYLRFAANVWNAGPSPLIVDGFRRRGEDLMDAYQYFYTADGTPAGSAQVGTMEWDDRDGHTHWHFTDFARYRLLDADLNAVVRSKKQAFCLAATDAIDLTLPGAEYRPWNTDLYSACGSFGALAVREALPVGSGDTYEQYRPGQAFRLAGLPNGRYFIEVTANPKGNLEEPDSTNNTAYRRIRLDGSGADRTVKVFAKGLVTRN